MPKITVTPPEGHPLRGGYNAETARRATDGDRHPSDLDDVFPTLLCKIATGAEIAAALEPVIVPYEPLAESNFRNDLGKAEAGGLRNGADDSKEDKACGDTPARAGCVYEVKVYYVTPQAVTQGCAGGPCSGQRGMPCYGPAHIMCHTFGAYFAATAFASQKTAEVEALRASCGYQVGKTDPYLKPSMKGIPSDGYGGECEDGGDGGNPGAPTIEITNPGCASPENNCNCPEDSKRNPAGVCEPVPGAYSEGHPCPPGHRRDENTRLCVPDDSACPPGFHLNQYGVCTPGSNK